MVFDKELGKACHDDDGRDDSIRRVFRRQLDMMGISQKMVQSWMKEYGKRYANVFVILKPCYLCTNKKYLFGHPLLQTDTYTCIIQLTLLVANNYVTLLLIHWHTATFKEKVLAPWWLILWQVLQA